VTDWNVQVVSTVRSAATRCEGWAAEWVKENVSPTADPPVVTEGSTILQF
jgi:hypothetical protein